MTTAINQILRPARDPEIPVRIKPPQIARAQILALIHLRRRFCSVFVNTLLRHAGACHANLADLINGTFCEAFGRIFEDDHIRMRKGDANRPNLFLTFNWVAGDKTSSLGQAISFDKADARCALKPAKQFQWQGG